LRSTQAQQTAHCNLGWTYEAIGDERQAVAHYRKTLELDPSLEGSGRQSQAVVGNARAAASSTNEV
jgi:tetratricopeptide (TPR) repeat protein